MATVYSNLQYTTVIYSIQSTSVDQNEWMIIGWWAWSPSELLPRSPVTVDISGREVSVTPIRCRAGGQEGRNVKLLKLKLSNLWMWNACVWKPSWPLPPQPMPYIYIYPYIIICPDILALISIRSVRCSAKCHELFGSVGSHWGYCWATVPSKGSGTAEFELHSPEIWIVTLLQRTT